MIKVTRLQNSSQPSEMEYLDGHLMQSEEVVGYQLVVPAA